MSIALMTLAWKSDLPSGRKLVLLALCDNANDQGGCFPSIPMLAKKCSMGERTVQQHISDMEAAGILTREMRTGRSTIYHINPRRFCTPADLAPPQILHPTPADSAPITIKEPSRNRKGTINKENAEQKFDPLSELMSLGVDAQAAQDWLKVRKAKNAPLTQTALDGMVREAAKAGISLPDAVLLCAERGWQALRADWVLPQKGSQQGRQVAPSSAQRSADNEEAKRLLFGKKKSEVIDV